MQMLLRSYFLSDLHIFARRSSAADITPAIHRAASQAHTLVLGGDIFDFKWSTRASFEHSIADSIQWLDELILSHPKCSFYYVLGNHDAHPRFVTELDRLAFRQPRLNWQPFVLRIHRCVFLHGDVVDCEPNEDAIATRRRAVDDKPRPMRSRHWLYDVVVKARLHRMAVHFAVRPTAVLRKLSIYLSSQGLDASNGIRDVYFGHTHRDVDGVKYDGMTFHNGGASIKGLEFRIIETTLPTIPMSTSEQNTTTEQ
jgi:UDP-2,3-diacylglucosamine pyrophosphatase LpxH